MVLSITSWRDHMVLHIDRSYVECCGESNQRLGPATGLKVEHPQLIRHHRVLNKSTIDEQRVARK